MNVQSTEFPSRKSFKTPLVCVFCIQFLVVAAAFTAVIVALSELQRNEFESALFRQLALQQDGALLQIINPLIQRQTELDLFVDLYMHPNVAYTSTSLPTPAKQVEADYYPYAVPTELSLLEDAAPFYNTIFPIMVQDPMVHMLVIANRSGYVSPSDPSGETWSMFVVDKAKVALVRQETAHVCLGAYPINMVSCFKLSSPFSTVNLIGTARNDALRTLWSRPVVIDDAWSGGPVQTIAYVIILNHGNIAQHNHSKQLAILTLKLTFIEPIIRNTTASINSISAAFTRDVRTDTADLYLLAGKVSFQMQLSGAYNSSYQGGSTPDPILNKAFDIAHSRCYARLDANPCASSQVMGLEADGASYTIAFVRHLSDNSTFDWLLVQYTPREDFYAASDKARLLAILIGLAGAIVVVAGCVLLWVAIRFPLLALRQNMKLAAEMKNEMVTPLSPVLQEMNELAEAFRLMNAKLLKARPFLPQSLLQGSENFGNASDDDDEGDRTGLGDSTALAESQTIERRQESSIVETHSDISAIRRKMQVGSETASSHVSGSKGPTSLTARRVAVLSINVAGFHSAMGAHQTPPRIDSQLTKMIEIAVAEERGIVDYFHGDRFVCGFNTAKTCGNAARNAGQAAVKIWDRFQDSQLTDIFPYGLSMGLGSGRAVIGVIGSDTMQRLGTLGYVFTESMRLQDAMSRRVLNGKVPSNLIRGRCLIMGRVMLDVEAALSFQVVGAVGAREFMPSVDQHDHRKIAAFARTKNMASQLIKVGISDTSQSSVLVAVLTAAHDTAGEKEEWLYQLKDCAKYNAYGKANAMISSLFLSGVVNNDEAPATTTVSNVVSISKQTLPSMDSVERPK